MKLFLDTEFTDFMNTQLISIGLVSECGNHEFYVEISDYNKKNESTFVQLIVVPLLEPAKYAATYEAAGAKLLDWAEGLDCESFDVVVNYSGDSMLMSTLLKPHYTTITFNYVFFNEEVKQDVVRESLHSEELWMPYELYHVVADHLNLATKASNEFFEQPGNVIHHALTDAKALRAGWLAHKAASLPPRLY